MKTMPFCRPLAVVTVAIVALAATAADAVAQRPHNITIEAGKTRSSRYTASLADYKISGTNEFVQAHFDRRTNRLRLRGIRPGRATIVFRGKVRRFVVGRSRDRKLRQDRPFEDVIYVTVTRSRKVERTRGKRVVRRAPRNKSRRPATRRAGTPRGRSKSRRPTKRRPVARRLPTIYKSFNRTLRIGRVGNTSLSSLFGGRADPACAVSASGSGVVSVDASRGRLKIRGIRRGRTTLRVRGRVILGGKRRDIVVILRLDVR